MAMLIDLVASNVAPVVAVAETGALNVSAVRELTVMVFLLFGAGGGVVGRDEQPRRALGRP